MAFVLDASATLARLAPDEILSPSITSAIEHDAIMVPALWPFEVANALGVMQRRGRLDAEAVTGAIALLVALAPEIESVNAARCWGMVFELARQFGLSVYDAAYLELAKRRRLPLATLDDALRRAARRAHLKLV